MLVYPSLVRCSAVDRPHAPAPRMRIGSCLFRGCVCDMLLSLWSANRTRVMIASSYAICMSLKCSLSAIYFAMSDLSITIRIDKTAVVCSTRLCFDVDRHKDVEAVHGVNWQRIARYGEGSVYHHVWLLIDRLPCGTGSASEKYWKWPLIARSTVIGGQAPEYSGIGGTYTSLIGNLFSDNSR